MHKIFKKTNNGSMYDKSKKDVYETLKEYFLTSKFLSSTCLDWELKYNDVGEYCNLPSEVN